MKELQSLKDNVTRAFKGDEGILELVLVTLISGGHLLIEDVPGVGKTTLAKGLARSISGKFSRIQFTPDLLPSDILGVSIYSPKDQDFLFKKGPIFSHILLADELNRTSPRTQSALLEGMNEAQVTVDGTTYPLPSPFMVLATQNPSGFDGTYSLPESQLDRFFMKLHLGYPSRDHEKAILKNSSSDVTADLEPVFSLEAILKVQEEVQQVHISEELLDYIVSLTSATRMEKEVLGVSPRGALALRRAAQGRAYLRGRDYCIPDDIRELLFPVLTHRILFRSQRKTNGRGFLQKILDETPIPK